MGRNRIYEVVKCGKCGKDSVVKDIPTRNNRAGSGDYHVYSYWVHTDKKKPLKCYKGPTGEHYPSINNRKTNDIFKWMVDDIVNETRTFTRNWKKFCKIILHFPINDKKASQLVNKWKAEFTAFQEAGIHVLDGYNDILKDIYASNHIIERKLELHFEEMVYFSRMLMPFRSQLKMWNTLLTDIMDFRKGESKLGWLKIMKHRIIMSDHAAASKSGVQTHDGKIRKFTPKQIHNKKIPELELLKSHILKKDIPDKDLLKYIDKMIETLEKDPFTQMLEYIYNYVNPKTGYSMKNVHADRRNRLHPKLSESAFSNSGVNIDEN